MNETEQAMRTHTKAEPPWQKRVRRATSSACL